MHARFAASSVFGALLICSLAQPGQAVQPDGFVWIEPFMPVNSPTGTTGHCWGYAILRAVPSSWRLDEVGPGGASSWSFSTAGPASSALLGDRCDGWICPRGSSVSSALYRVEAGYETLVSSLTLPC